MNRSARKKSAPTTHSSSTSSRPRREALGREAWLDAARDALLAEGIGGVEIGKLARHLGVTRGGFYWFFSSRQQLLDELLTYWERTSSALFGSVVRGETRNGMSEFLAVVGLQVAEKDYDPAWDVAMREWARTSPTVARVVRKVDDHRIGVFHQIFLDMGYRDPEALVRARVTYYHQVGYYALGVHQSRKQRLALLPHYIRVLSGREP